MENKIVTALLAILLALGGWNLSQTFKLSNDMVLVKEKISNIEDKVSKFKPNKRNKKELLIGITIAPLMVFVATSMFFNIIGILTFFMLFIILIGLILLLVRVAK